MNANLGKRITFKRTRPNPLFQDWLEELHEGAKQKKSKVEKKIREALDSLEKYPLPLESGAECAILKGFDHRLCSYLDQRLAACTKLDTKLPSNIFDNVSSSDAVSSTEIFTANSVVTASEERSTNIQCYTINSKTDIQYRPAFRSGGYAILMALLDQATVDNNQGLKKTALIDKAQKYSEESFTKNKPGTYYSAWANMSRLINKGLVYKVGGKQAQYSLTELGITVAKDLLTETQKKPCMNDIIFNDPPFKPKSKQNSNLDLAFDEVGDNLNTVQEDDECSYTNHVNKETNEIEINKKSTTNNYKNIAITQRLNIGDEITEDNHDLIIMEPHSFDIILLIDKNETSGPSKKNDPTVVQFNKYPDLKHEYRSLKVGDFTWVASHKVTNQELVLPYIVERKRMDDLGASIKDGRFHEQKFRLRKCGINRVIYMVENYGSNKHVGLPLPTLMQALANTRVQDGFEVQVTESLTHSARFLAMMTSRLMFEFQNKKLSGHNREAQGDILMTFEFFNKSSVKNKPLSVTDTFIKLLLQLKGVSVQKALAITNVYKTPASLIKEYKNCIKKDGEMLLANLRCDDQSRSVGPSVSKTVYQLLTLRNFT